MTDDKIKQTEALYNELKECINKASEEKDGLYADVVLNALLNLDAEVILMFAKKGKEGGAIESYCKKLTIAAASRAAIVEVFSKYSSDDEDAENDDTETSENTENNTENDNNGND